MSEPKTSEAQRRAVIKYTQKHDRVNCNFAAGTLERIKKCGYESTQKFIRQAVYSELDRIEKLNS